MYSKGGWEHDSRISTLVCAPSLLSTKIADFDHSLLILGGFLFTNIVNY